MLLGLTIGALSIALAMSQFNNSALKSDNGELSDTLDSFDFMVNRRDEEILQYREGCAYLVRLAQTPEWNQEYAPLLSAINRNGFAFKKFKLDALAGYSVYSFSEAKRNPDRSERLDHNPKSLCLLIDNQTLT